MNHDSILEAVWCKDSETNIEYLIELKTGKKLLVKYKDGSVGEYWEDVNG